MIPLTYIVFHCLHLNFGNLENNKTPQMPSNRMEIVESNSDDENANNVTSPNSFQERKSCYRSLLNKVEEIVETKELGLQTATAVGSILKKINALEKEYSIENRVDQTDETLLDCMVLSSSSSILVKCINAVDISTSTYEPSDFCQKLCDNLKSEDEEFQPLDFLKLITEARSLIPEVDPYEFVYGTFEFNKLPTPKEKKVIKKVPKENYTKKEPENVKTVNKEEESIDAIVNGLFDVLKEEYSKNRERPINYYDFVIDTGDFSRTVENMFYCSFLIRDGKAKLDLNDKIPIIQPVLKREVKQFRDGGGVNSQIITSIAMEDWENFKKEGFLQKRRHLALARKK